MKPDFGMLLCAKGDSEGGSVQMPFPITSLGYVGDGLYCASATTDEFCATIDLDTKALDQLLLVLPAPLTSQILKAIRKAKTPRTVGRFQPPIEIEVEGAIGPTQRTINEQFRPIVAKEVTRSGGMVPASAEVLLIELGIMVDAIERGKLPESHSAAIRRRIVSLGERLNRQGGLELMQDVCSGAAGYLASRKVHVGRYFESVWDRIGQWRS